MTPATGTRAAALAGTGALVRLAVRRDRFQLPAWLCGLAGLTAATTAMIKDSFPTHAELLADTTFAATSPAIRVLGLASGASTGAYTMIRDYVTLAVLAAVMSILAVVRHTRQGEETGRSELLRATVLGRHADLAAAVLVTLAANVALAFLVTAALLVNGLPTAGSFAAGAAVATVGVTFTGVAAVSTQLAGTTRGASGLAAAVLGAAFLLNGVGNMVGTVDADGPRVISAWPVWLSPIGWGQQVRPFDRDRWPVLGLPAALLAACLITAWLLAGRRDHGLGLLPQRRGRATASRALRTPLGLVLRLHRGTLAGWATGMLGFGLVWGAVAKQAVDPGGAGADWYTRIGGTDRLLDAYRASIMAMAGMATAVYLVQVLLRARAQESDGLLDPVLATAVGRARWLAGHLAGAALGALGLLLLFATGMALTAGAVLGDPGGQLRDLAWAAVVQLPGVLVPGSVVVAVVGAAPRAATPVSWTLTLAAVLLGPVFDLGLPRWVRACSPFTHVPMVPGTGVTAAPVLSLVAVCAALTLAGLVSLRRRDLTSPG